MRDFALRYASCLLTLGMLLGASSMLGGCAGRSEPSVAYALDGPPLFIRGEYDGMPVKGQLDRAVMVGVGALRLEAEDAAKGFICESQVNADPTEKGRIRGVLDCTGGEVLVFTLRNLGPDQGVGLGRQAEGNKPLTFFYHASDDEAARRFPGVKADIQEAQRVAAGGSTGGAGGTQDKPVEEPVARKDTEVDVPPAKPLVIGFPDAAKEYQTEQPSRKHKKSGPSSYKTVLSEE